MRLVVWAILAIVAGWNPLPVALGQTAAGTRPAAKPPAAAGPASAAAPASAAPAPNNPAPTSPPAAPPNAAAPLTPPVTAEVSPVPTAQRLPGEVGPELYLLKDKQGRLQAVPGFRFEEFIDLYRLKNQLAGTDDRPRFVLSHSMITGNLRGQVVAMSLVLTIETNDSHWLRIPLGLSNSIVEGDARLDGPGEVLIEYTDLPAVDRQKSDLPISGDRAGYTLWLRAEAQKAHKVTIPLVTPVATVGGETQLRLDAPRASVAQLVVEIPSANVVARVSDGAALLDPQVAANKTTFSVVGASGPLELAWRPAGSELAVAPSVLEASGTTWARIDGRSVNYETKLSVRSFGGQFDSFRVRLPQGAQMTGNQQAGVSIVPVPAAANETTGGNVVEVKLEKKTSGPYELRLQADRARAADNSEELLELAGFEVLGAVRQSGSIGVQVVGNWQVVWGESRGVRQIDEVPEALRRDELVAAFEYSSQPCSLTARVVPRRTRVSVQPRYVLTVGAHETRLAVELKYTIRGAKMRALTLNMPGWEIDQIGPANVVNVDAATIEDAAQFSIPLAQPSNGDLTLSVTARRMMPGNGKPEASQMLEFELPRPIAEVVAPAVVVVQAEDSIELTPRSESLVGLSLRSSRPSLPLPAMQQDPLFYQTDGAASKFVADFKVNAQQIMTSIEGRVDLDEQEVQVEERMRYDILYEPVEKLTLLVPRSIPLDKLEVTLEGTRLTLASLREGTDVEGRDSTRVSVLLGGSRIGRCELVAAFRLVQEKLPPSASVPVSLPLVMPGDGLVKQNRMLVRAESGISVNTRKGAWTIDERTRLNGTRQEGIWLTASEASDKIDLGITLQDRSREASTLVERTWIQTWLTDRGRQDRAVFQLSTSERRLRVTLPAGVAAGAAQALLDGKTVALEVDNRGGIVVPLPANGVEQRHLLELNYHIGSRASAGAISLAPPRLVPAVWTRRLYWQVVLPGHEHLIVSPIGFTSESKWEWTGRYWQRTPTINERDLKQWIGLADTTSLMPEGANCYLFSSVGECPELSFRTARRASLVFGASLAVLLAGLALLYVPACRHPGLLFAVAIALLAVGLMVPDLAVLAAQAALLGGALIGLAMFLATKAARSTVEVEKESSTAMAPSMDRSATDLYYRATSSEAPQSTATAPLVLPTTGAETAI